MRKSPPTNSSPHNNTAAASTAGSGAVIVVQSAVTSTNSSAQVALQCRRQLHCLAKRNAEPLEHCDAIARRKLQQSQQRTRCPAPPGAAGRHERQRERRQTLARTLHPLAAVRYGRLSSPRHETRPQPAAPQLQAAVLRSRSGPEVAAPRWRQQETRRAFYRHGECRQREKIEGGGTNVSVRCSRSTHSPSNAAGAPVMCSVIAQSAKM
jgi:hypothetical protein